MHIIHPPPPNYAASPPQSPSCQASPPASADIQAPSSDWSPTPDRHCPITSGLRGHVISATCWDHTPKRQEPESSSLSLTLVTHCVFIPVSLSLSLSLSPSLFQCGTCSRSLVTVQSSQTGLISCQVTDQFPKFWPFFRNEQRGHHNCASMTGLTIALFFPSLLSRCPAAGACASWCAKFAIKCLTGRPLVHKIASNHSALLFCFFRGVLDTPLPSRPSFLCSLCSNCVCLRVLYFLLQCLTKLLITSSQCLASKSLRKTRQSNCQDL